MTVPQTLLVFDAFNSCEEYWSGTLWNASLLKFISCFSHDKTGVMGFEEEDHRSIKCYFMTSYRKYILLTQFITVDVDPAYLAEGVCQVSPL